MPTVSSLPFSKSYACATCYKHSGQAKISQPHTHLQPHANIKHVRVCGSSSLWAKNSITKFKICNTYKAQVNRGGTPEKKRLE